MCPTASGCHRCTAAHGCYCFGCTAWSMAQDYYGSDCSPSSMGQGCHCPDGGLCPVSCNRGLVEDCSHFDCSLCPTAQGCHEGHSIWGLAPAGQRSSVDLRPAFVLNSTACTNLCCMWCSVCSAEVRGTAGMRRVGGMACLSCSYDMSGARSSLGFP